MSLTYKKYTFPDIECTTHKAFIGAVKSYLFKIVCANKELFSYQQLNHKNIHICKGESGDVQKYIAPFWQNKQFGVVAYGLLGDALVKLWLELLERDYPHLAFYNEETFSYTLKSIEGFKCYQSQFWMPTSNTVSFNNKSKMWYNHTSNRGKLIVDFVGAFQNGLINFFDKNEFFEVVDLLKKQEVFLALSDLKPTMLDGLGYANKRKNTTPFKVEIKANIELPKIFHIGAAIGYGNGCFIEKSENKKSK